MKQRKAYDRELKGSDNFPDNGNTAVSDDDKAFGIELTCIYSILKDN